jgi:hypothetical protein
MTRNIYGVTKVSGYYFLFWATRYMYICMYVRIYVSSNYNQHASSLHCSFSMNDQLQSLVTCWSMRIAVDSVHNDTDKPGPVNILWKRFLPRENNLDIFSKFILLHRFSSRFKFNKYHTSKTRAYVWCSQDGVDEVSSLLVNIYCPLGPSYGDSTLFWNIFHY